MYSYLTKDGKVLDYRFKTMLDSRYAFYVGDIYVGQVGKYRNRRWSAVPSWPCEVCPVWGFATRLDACEFLLNMMRIRDNA